MAWIKWLLPAFGVFVLIMGYVVDTPQKFQVSTGWIGLVVCLAGFLVVLAVEQSMDEHH